MLNRIAFTLAYIFLSCVTALAQPSPPAVTQSGTVTANHLSIWNTNRQIKDGGALNLIFSGFPNCNIWGAIPFIGTGGAIACLDPTGHNGQFLQSQDANADPILTAAGGGSGTVTSQGATSSGSSIAITATSGSNPNTAAAVFNFDLATIATNRILGNVSGGAAIPTAITPTQLTTFCNVFSGALSGCVGPGSGANNVIHGDNSFGQVVAGDIASNAVTTAKILDANVTYAKIQNVTNARLLGNNSGGAAAPSEISVDSSLVFASATSIGRAALTGDATASASSNTTTVVKVNGVSFPASPSVHQIPIVTASNTVTWKTVPDCVATGSTLQYTQSSDTLSCAVMVNSIVAGNGISVSGASGNVTVTARGCNAIGTPTVASGAASVTIITPFATVYQNYRVTIYGLTVSTDGATISIRTGTGGAVLSGATDYQYAHTVINSSIGTVSGQFSGGASSILINVGVGNDTGESMDATLELYNSQSTTLFKHMKFYGTATNIASNTIDFQGSGTTYNVGALDRIRFTPSAGTMSGTIAVCGWSD